MLRTRVIPVLLLRGESLVKTVRFGRFTYVGDPANTVRIFNELEVDELLFLDISATRDRRMPNLKVLREVANECFMPVAYGGGISTITDAKSVFDIGFEKIAINSAALSDPDLITRLASTYGSQAVIVAIDVKSDAFGNEAVYQHAQRRTSPHDPVGWAREAEARGAGEILLTDVNREGTWAGFNLDLVRRISSAVSIPVIAHGGAGSVTDIGAAVRGGHASAVALGSMVVFQKRGMGVLINFPEPDQLTKEIS